MALPAPAGIDEGVRMIAHYLMTYAPPAGTFPESGAWKMTYDLLEWHGKPVAFAGRPGNEKKLLGNHVTGQLAVTCRPGAAGGDPSYELDHTITMNAFESSLKSTMQCTADPLPALLSWHTDYENHPVKTEGPTTRLSEDGSHQDGVLKITSKAGTRQFQTTLPVAPQWAVLDAVRSMKAESMTPIEFDLLHDLTSYRPRQKLKPCGTLNLTLGGKSYVFHGFLQTGRGVEPVNYWVDEAGRPLFLTGGLLSCAMTSVEAIT